MSRRERAWNELQTRWARGDQLSEEEERERRAYAEADDLARRELEIFDALRARATSTDEPARAPWLGRLTEGAQSPRRLRLVTASLEVADSPRAPVASGRRAKFVAAGALLFLAAGAAALAFSTTPRSNLASSGAVRAPYPASLARAELVLSAGQVTVAERPAELGQRLLGQGERLSTASGRACLTIDPGIDVCLAENSTIELASLDSKHVRVGVTRGTALASLTRRDAGSAFTLSASGVTATAHGTTYAVHHDGSEAEVVVVEGAVEVARGADERELVEAHSRVVVPARSGPFVRAPVGRSEEARLLALRATHRLWGGATVGVLDLADSPRAQKATVDDEGELPLPLQVFVGAGVHRIVWLDAAGVETASVVELAAGETRRLAAPEPPSASPSAVASKPSAGALLERARRALAGGQRRQALSLYENLLATYPSSAEARTVLVTMGKLELELGQPGRALARFETYLQRGGNLTPEALAGRARSLRALGRTREERNAIQQYLAAQSNGFDAPLFAKRLRELPQP